jgi:hypothetical protein
MRISAATRLFGSVQYLWAPAFVMRFEDQVRVLCARALGTRDEVQVHAILAELRFVLHQRIEQLRGTLQSGYAASLRRSRIVEIRSRSSEPAVKSKDTETSSNWPKKKWQTIVHEIKLERDPKRALVLSRELSRLMQSYAESANSREESA